jgi:hypothetical protein
MWIGLSASSAAAQDRPIRAPEIQPSAAPPVTYLVDSLDPTTVGQASLHSLHFAIQAGMPVDGQFRVTFPGGFDLQGVSVAYWDGFPGPFVSSWDVSGQSIWIKLDSTGLGALTGDPLLLLISDVVNDTVARGNQVSLEVFRRDSSLMFGPTLSEPFYLDPGPATELSLAPTGPQQVTAGSTLTFSSIVRDTYGNRFDTPTVSYRVVPDSLGTFTGGVFQARRPGTGAVIAAYAGLEDTSGALTVVPGALSLWRLTGIPQTATAGVPLGSDSVIVTAVDDLGNVKWDFLGDLYFAVSDTGATLPATASSPYTFLPADSGRVAFPQTGFRLVRAGSDTLRTTGDGISAYNPILVAPAAAVNFALFAPDTVVAGAAFTVAVDSLLDAYGNAVSGNVDLYLESGDSLSPGGFRPNLPPVTAVAGSGSSQAILYNAGTYSILGRQGDTVRTVPAVTVMAAPTDRFEWSLSSPQFSTAPFVSPATLTAYDPYANLAVAYDVEGDTVLLAAVNGDSMSSNRLPPGVFSAGVADLAAAGVTYHGRGGQVRFVAAAGAAGGLSEPIEVLAFTVDTLVLARDQVRRGVDTLTGRITVRVVGSGVATVTALELTSALADFPLDSVTPILTDSLFGPAARDYQFRWPVPAGLPLTCIQLGARAFGAFSGYSVTAEITADSCLTIQSGSIPRLAVVSPTLVAYDTVRYDVAVANDGQVGSTLLVDSLRVLVHDSAGHTDTAHPIGSGQLYLPASDSVWISFATRHVPAFDGDGARLSLELRGIEAGLPTADSIAFAAPLSFFAPFQVSYLQGSLLPDTVVMDRADTVRVGLRHFGGLPLANIQTGLTRLTMAGGADTAVLAFLPGVTPLDSWPPGDTTLAFELSAAAARIASGKYELTFVTAGTQNNLPLAAALTLTDSLSVVGAPRIRTDSVWVVAPNVPTVSVNQSFQLIASISNQGAEPLDSIRLRLVSDSNSVFTDTASIASILKGASAQVSWSVTAAAESNVLETFQVRLLRAVGRYSGKSADILPAISDQAAVQIQSAAALEVHSRIKDPPDAADHRVAAGSQFSVAGRFSNTGEAATSGGDLGIMVDGGLQINSPDTQTVSVDREAEWSLTAPSADTAAFIIIELADQPQELNTSQPAVINRRADTLAVQIVFEVPPLTVYDVETAGGPVSDVLVPIRWRWRNDDPSGTFPILVERLAVELTAAQGGTLLDPARYLSGAQLEFDNDTVAADLSGGVLDFGTGNLHRIPSGDSESVLLRVFPAPSTTLTQFRFATRDNLWEASETSVGGAGLPVQVLDDRGRPLSLVSDLAFQPGDVPSNYPNPFRAGAEPTQIQYTLPVAAAVEIRIYSTAGEEVWEFQAGAGVSGGMQGVNTVVWDGRNGDGKLVVDGVYIARITGGGVDADVKIAVVK